MLIYYSAEKYFDTSKVTDIEDMFCGCENLTELDAMDRLYEDTLTNSVKTYGQKHASFFKNL